MATRPRPNDSGNVVPLFEDETFELEPLPMGRTLVAPAPASPQPGTVVDLNGKPKLVVALGPGHSGKTMLMRWIGEHMLDGGRSPAMAAIDPENRDLLNFFGADVLVPKSSNLPVVVDFLRLLMGAMVKRQTSYLLDTGGGDTAFAELFREWPSLVSDLADAGIATVAAYPLSPRITDMSLLTTLESAGFQPAATALILNEGRVELGRDPEQEFAELRRQPIYRETLARGAVELHMPRLAVAKKVEDRRLQFAQALKGGRTTADGRPIPPLGWADQKTLAAWLMKMQTAFAPVLTAGWIP
ncbi:MAG: hypothetical protein ACJ8AW_09450 [Rhodopila sp.]